MQIKINNVEFRVQKEHDFGWLNDLGQVFTVYDEQDSGNLLFGVENADGRYFVKYAGAQPVEYTGSPADAVSRLKQAAVVYEALRHPSLVRYIGLKQNPSGLALIFEWFDGRGLHEHWTFAQCGKYQPGSPYKQYLDLPLDKKLASVKIIFEFLQYVESMGYVPVDFYDGSIMYDFERDATRICDVDFFRQAPVVNDLGEDFWGSSRFKAPEEYVKGAAINSATTVFTMGAMLSHFFGGSNGRDIAAMYRDGRFYACNDAGWQLSQSAYAAVSRATAHDPKQRFKTIAQFYTAWQQAV